jgi:hypothetical protein
MKHSARPSATTSSFSASVHQQLNAYALAAGAASVGILALSRSAEAKIVYTPANVHINSNLTYALKFNQKTDFLFLATGYVSTNAHGSSQIVALAQGRNGVEGTRGNASALSSGAVIGPKQHFSGKLLEHCTWADTYVCRGDWAFLGGQPRYLGLKFYIGGKIHYGWARLTLTFAENTTLSGYAYETIPNKPIIAGKTKGRDTVDDANQKTTAFSNLPIRKPASLGTLAMGSSGLTIWRRESAGD